MKLVRFKQSKDVTIGRLEHEDIYFYTVERPWLDNTPNVSCIPDGTYIVGRTNSPRFGENMWEVLDVPGRTHILIHVANYPHNVKGCIGFGTGVFGDLSGVTSSGNAIERFYRETDNLDELELIVTTGAIYD